MLKTKDNNGDIPAAGLEKGKTMWEKFRSKQAAMEMDKAIENEFSRK
jgi:hypothetical protein